MELFKIKTPCGFEARVNENAMQDMEIYDAVRGFVSALQNNQPPDIRGTLIALLGENGYRAFAAYEKKHAGFVRVDHGAQVIEAVIDALDRKKKS